MNTKGKKVSSSQTYPQLYGNRAQSSCEGPSDSAWTKSNDDQRNPSKKLPYDTTPQEAPQPPKSQKPNNPRRSRQTHKRTPLDTLILPHSEDRAEVSNESRERKRLQTVDYALSIEHSEKVVATKAIAEWKIRSNSKEEIESESINQVTLRSKDHLVEEGLPKAGTSKTRPATGLQQSGRADKETHPHQHKKQGPCRRRSNTETQTRNLATPKDDAGVQQRHQSTAPTAFT
jgi:hypothetical protein